jgi:hypothetical protein
MPAILGFMLCILNASESCYCVKYMLVCGELFYFSFDIFFFFRHIFSFTRDIVIISQVDGLAVSAQQGWDLTQWNVLVV